MNLNNQLQFFRKRSFLEIFGFSFDFFRTHFKSLFRLMLIVIGPVLLTSMVIGIVFSNELIGLMKTTQSGTMGPANIQSQATSFSLFSFLSYTISYFQISLLQTLVGGYIFLFLKEGKESITTGRMFRFAYGKVWLMMALNLIYAIIVMLSSIGLVTGIWLFISLSLCGFIIIYEDLSPGDALSRSYNLIKNNWWFTFGIILFSMVCFTVLTFVTTGISQGIFMLLISFSQEVGEEFILISSLAAQLVYVFTTLCMSFYIIVLAVHYGNLRERKEEKGKYLLIESIGMSDSKLTEESLEVHELA